MAYNEAAARILFGNNEAVWGTLDVPQLAAMPQRSNHPAHIFRSRAVLLNVGIMPAYAALHVPTALAVWYITNGWMSIVKVGRGSYAAEISRGTDWLVHHLDQNGALTGCIVPKASAPNGLIGDRTPPPQSISGGIVRENMVATCALLMAQGTEEGGPFAHDEQLVSAYASA